MDYKVKYEQAIADARAIIKDYKERHLDDIAKRSEEDFSAVFPELKESEDERIRQRIIHALHGDVLEMSEIKEAIDWLEKQGEHSVSPLFTFEDVLTIQCAMAYAKFQDRKLDVALKKLHDKVYDAYHDSKNHHIESQDGLKGEQIPDNSTKTCKDEQKPYGKREECYDCQMNYGGTCKGSCAMKRGEQKHVEWSEEDKDMLRMLLEMINYASDHYQHDDKATDIKAWVLKSLKGRVGCEVNCTTTWKPSDEQIEALAHCNSITNEQAELEQKFLDEHLDKHDRMPTFLDAIEYGMRLQKEQMMKGAFEFTRKHNDACVLASECLRDHGWFNREHDFNDLFLYLSCVDELFAGKFSGKTKVIVIKED